MTCQACLARAINQYSGLYNFRCLDCCAHLVASANPEIERAQSFFYFIEVTMKNDAPNKKEIWSRAKQIVREKKEQK